MPNKTNKVKLKSSSPSLLSQGSLNSIFLQEQGYHSGMEVGVVDSKPNGSFTVRLPSGYLLHVTTEDVE